MSYEQPTPLSEKLRHILEFSAGWAAPKLIQISALISIISIWQSATSGAELPSALAAIASGIGVEALGHLLTKLDNNESLDAEEILQIVETAITESNIEELLTYADFQKEMAALFNKLDILGGTIGTALQHHETQLARRILEGLTYYHQIWIGEAEAQLNILMDTLERMNPERHYLEGMVKYLKGQSGVWDEYVGLNVLTEAQAEGQQPIISELWNLPNYFSVLEANSDLASTAPPLERPRTALENGIAEAIEKFPCFVLIGKPGAGKTVTLQHLALTAGHAKLAGTKRPVPLILNLSNWTDNTSFQDFLRSGWPLPTEITHQLASGDVCLYLDGLNEMGGLGEQKVKLLRKWLNSGDVSQNLIVTCRDTDYIGDFDLGLPIVFIEDLDETLIVRFAQNYLGDEAKAFLAQVLPTEGAQDSPRHIFTLAHNPFLLMALLYLYKKSPASDLPDNAGLLFQNMVKLLWNRESEKQTLGWVSYDQMLKKYSRLAFEMTEEGKTSVTVQYAQAIVDDSGLLKAGQSASILEVREGQVRFFHQLIQEYFASIELQRIGVQNKLTPPQFYSWGRIPNAWDYVIISLCGVSPHTVSEITHSDPYLAAQCIATGVSVSDSVRQVLAKELVKSLDSSDRRVRKAVSGALKAVKGPLALDALLKLLDDEDIDVRRIAAEVLGSLRVDVAVPHLINATNDTEWTVRRAAVSALGEIGDTAAALTLASVMQYERDLRVTNAAHEAFAKLDVVIPSLLASLSEGNPEQRMVSAWVLGRICTPDPIFDWQTEQERTPEVVSALLVAFQEGDENVRLASIEALWNIRDPSTTLFLLESIHDRDANVRYWIVSTLGMIGDEEAIPALSERLRSDSDYEVQAASAISLGQIGNPVAVDDLLLIVEDGTRSWSVREAAVTALGWIGDDKVLTTFLQQLWMDLDQIDWFEIRDIEDFQEAVVIALANIGTSKALEAAKEWEKERGYPVSYDIPNLTTAQLGIVIEQLWHEDYELRKGAVGILKRAGGAVIEDILAVLLNKDDVVYRDGIAVGRINAALVLSYLGEKRIVPRLIPLLADEDPHVRGAIADALGEIGDEAAVNVLIELLTDGELCWNFGTNRPVCVVAAHALMQIGTPEAKQMVEIWQMRQPEEYHIKNFLR